MTGGIWVLIPAAIGGAGLLARLAGRAQRGRKARKVTERRLPVTLCSCGHGLALHGRAGCEFCECMRRDGPQPTGAI